MSYQWLKELTGVDWSVEQMAEKLTLCGLACEDLISTARHMDKVVVGEVTGLEAVEGADKIRKATVCIGDESLSVICGAPNVAVGQKVPMALIGAKLAGDLTIKKAKIRGVVSSGMICAQDELGISSDHAGIWVLDPAAVPGTPLVDALDFDDYIMDFEMTPNRGDAMSAIGIARDVAALALVKVVAPGFDLKPSPEKVSGCLKVSIADPDACPRFTGRIIRNVKIGPSPWWVQKKLLTAGVRPISNVVDVTNLVLLETGNPIHAFDFDKFGSNEVVVRRARPDEKFKTLDGKDHTLTPDVLLITNGKEGKAAAGVMGGFDSEVTDKTTNVLLEVAYFNPVVIRRSRKQIGVVSEASIRFEKGVDPNNVLQASARAASLLQEICGGEVLDGVVDCYPEKIEPLTIELRPGRCNDILGTTMPTKRMAEILSALQLEVSGTDTLKVIVPTFRPDIIGEIDLIEEIARIEGYEAIPDAIYAKGPLVTSLHPGVEFEDELRKLMTGAGYDEMLGHGLADSRHASLLNPDLPQLEILNPVSEDLNIMRNDLVQTALTVIGHNLAHRNLDLKFFEIGRAYFPPDSKGVWVEDDRLLLAVTGNTPANWRERPRAFDFFDLSGALNQISEHFGWPAFEFEKTSKSYLDSEISFTVRHNGDDLGWIGRIKPEIERKFDIKQAVYVAQIGFSSLLSRGQTITEFTPLPIYPAATRDLALVVDKAVEAGRIVQTVKTLAGGLAESVEIFDLYVGKQIGSGKKSIGIAISYRLAERSLSGDEIDKAQLRIVNGLKQEFDAQVRDK